MLSELVAMTTSYYFDRNNMFPATGRMVLHTHWDPRKFNPELSLYIVRNPVSVAASVLNFYHVNGWAKPSGNPLADPKICRMDWSEHVTSAMARGIPLVDYDRLMVRDTATVAALAEHLSARPHWIESALTLLSEMHQHAPHQTDAKFHRAGPLATPEGDGDRERLQSVLKDEIDLYQRAFGTTG